ncbi:MAG: thiamine phosphate synthase [Archangium sp.]
MTPGEGQPFRLILITDWGLDDCLERVAAVANSVDGVAIQHRHPGASDRVFYEQGQRLRDAIRAPLFVNGRVDVALALEAHVHLTESSLDVAHVRSMLPRERLISVSWHSGEVRAGADLALLSPVFKKGDAPVLGVARFEEMAATTSIPVFALGGVTPENAGLLRGHSGVAAIGSVLHAPDPVAAARALLQRER